MPNPWPTKLLAPLLLACLLVGAGTSALVKSATWDETHYFGVGRALLSSGDWDFPGSVLHPPLAFYLSSLPLVFSDLDQSGFERRRGDLTSLAAADIERGQALLSDPANENDRLLNRSRLAMILLALFLGGCVFAWSRDLYGPGAGLLSLLFFCFSPNILAHARLITPDIVLTTFSFVTLYALWKSLELESPHWAAAAGISLGLALLSKYTALLLLPLCGVLILLWKLKRGSPGPRSPLLLLAVATGTFFLGYGFDAGPYLLGIEFQLQHAGEGHESFLLGHRSSSGWWYYFLVAFALKTPLPTLLLLAASLVLSVSRGRSSRWLDEAFLLLPIGAFLAFFSLKHQSIGLRYILPVYPFAFVFLAKAFAASSGSGNRIRIALASLLVVWYVGSSVYIHPHYLAYFNELAGGPSRGYRSLVDSNLDWGQDLKGLKQYMRERGIERINLSYFGSDTPTRYGIDYDWLPSLYLRDPRPDLQRIFPPDGWIAISATNLQGVYLDDPDIFAFLREREPVAKIGYSIFVYAPDAAYAPVPQTP
jgi:4-amino-4-deoxy-L-arabinose transferase-like glycosyltransferase